MKLMQGQTTEGCDEYWQVVDEHGEAVAACGLWWNAVPPYPSHRLGVIGLFYSSRSTAAGLLLEHACQRLREKGCTLAVGPMNGSTWKKYRLVTERGSEPPFLMEPWNPEDWPDNFTAAGFSPLAEYSSSLNTDLSKRDPRTERVWQRLQQSGVTLRDLNLDDFTGDLQKIYAVSVVSFTRNFLYTPIVEQDFIAQYLPIRDKVRPELVQLVEHAGKPVGYSFAIPDYAEAQRGEKIRSVIFKTLAILPGKLYGGLGAVLMDRVHQRAAELGYDRVIHALQYNGNNVCNMSDFYGPVMRRYTLYSRSLA